MAPDFVLVVLKTMGTWGSAAWSFINEVVKRISSVTGDVRATSFLRQRLSLAVQRGNAASVIGTYATNIDS